MTKPPRNHDALAGKAVAPVTPDHHTLRAEHASLQNAAGAFSAVLLLTGCAHYAPSPLEREPALLSAPVASALEANASAVRRPWLTPITIDLSEPLSPDAVAAIAVVNGPDLKSLRARAGVADAQAFAAGLLPDPTLSLGGDKVLSGPDTLLNLAATIGLDLNALRTRGVTRERANAEARQVRLDLAWAEWQAAGDARIQAVRIAGLSQVLDLARQSDATSASLLARNLAASGRGDVSAGQVEAARLAAVDAADKLGAALRDLATARQALNRLLGLPPTSDVRLAAEAAPSAPPDPAALFAIASDSRLDLQALQAGYAAQEAVVRKAVMDQFPNLTLSVNANRDSAGNTLLGPAIDFTLPLWNRDRGGIAIERATREALKAEYDARLFQTRSDIFAAVNAIEVARRQRSDAEQGLAALRQYALSSRRAAERGDVSVANAQAVEQTLRDRLTLIAQKDQDLEELTIALELLTGAPRKAWAG